MKIAVIGSVAKDHIYIKSQGVEYHQAGGGVYYASMALASLGIEVLAMPLLAEDDISLLDSFDRSGIEMHPLWTEKSSMFKLIYPTEQLDVREKVLLSSAEDHHLSDESLKELATCDGIHVSPLSSREFPADTFERLRKYFDGMISLDAQGFANGDSVDVASYIKDRVDILKLDDDEAKLLADRSTEGEAIEVVKKWNIPEVLITKSSRGSTIYCGDEKCEIPAYPPHLFVDATGCGDTYVAGYLTKRVEDEDPAEAAHYAARLATKVIEVKGAL
ncbi:MAG: hypothetical protein HN337_09830 [Deltaproteobacteria bacterium]|nr:hypothetical protein [Deltaproteobacteria bacterium]